MFKKSIAFLLVLILSLAVFTICPFGGDIVSAEAVYATPISTGFTLKTDKDYYLTGETVMVTATGKSENDWVGIRKQGDVDSITYYTLTAENNGTAVALQTSGFSAGVYEVYVIPNDLFASSGKIVAMKTITISDNLAPKKRVFAVGEDILISARGSVSDGAWIGVRPISGATMSMYYVHLNDSNNGTAINIKNGTKQNSFDGFYDFPAGIYEVYFVPASGTYSNKSVSYYITVTSSGEAEALELSYKLDGESDGMADGTVTVKNNDYGVGDSYSAYWVNEYGIPISGYTNLRYTKIAGNSTEIVMPSNTLIPQEARGLKVYVTNGTTELGIFGTVSLPEEAAMGDLGTPLYTFPMISDIHTEYKPSANFYSTYNFPLKRTLTDIKNLVPVENGIYINGDITNNGVENEYKQLQSLLSEVYGSTVPQVFISTGNHDCWGNSPTEAQKLFIKYSNILQTKVSSSKVYYDYWIGDSYHFIILGDEDTTAGFTVNKGLNAIISDAQFTFLDNALAQSRSKKDCKTFIMLHQSLYRTISGTFLPCGDKIWNGIGTNGDDSNNAIANKFRSIMAKYSNKGDSDIFLFGGHTHFDLNCDNNMYKGDDSLPYIFNTAGVANTVYDYFDNKTTYFESQGYIIEVYEDRVILRGRNFAKSKWMPSATYCIYDNEGHAVTPDITNGSGDITLNTASESGKYASGQQVSVNIAPAAGYKVTSVKVNGTPLSVIGNGAAADYTFNMPATAVKLSVEFSLISSEMESVTEILYPDTHSTLGVDTELSASEYLTDSTGGKHYFAKFVNAIPTYSAHQNTAQSYADMQVNGYTDSTYLPGLTYYLYASKAGSYNVQLSYGIGTNNEIRYPISEEPYYVVYSVNGKIIKGQSRYNSGYYTDTLALSLETGINEVNVITILPETYSHCHRWVNVTKLTIPSSLIGVRTADVSTTNFGSANLTAYNKMRVYDDGKIGMVGDGATFARTNGATFENLNYSELNSKTPYFTLKVSVPYSGHYNLKMDFNIGQIEERGYLIMFVDGAQKTKVSLVSGGSAWYNKVKLPPVYLTKGEHTITLTSAYNCKSTYRTHDGYSTWTDFHTLSVLTPDFTGNYYKFGDCNDNGTIDTADLVLLKKMLLNSATTTARGETLSDTSGDGEIGLTDLLRLTRYLADSSIAIGPR